VNNSSKAETAISGELEERVAEHKRLIEQLEIDHTKTVTMLQDSHATTTATLEQLKSKHEEALRSRSQLEDKLASLPAPESIVAKEEHDSVLQSLAEMEKTLATVEEQKTNLRIENNQIKFELSKVRDEHAHHHQAQVAEMAELQKKVNELSLNKERVETRSVSRYGERGALGAAQSPNSGVPRPPIGPPPTIPVPPIPVGAVPMSPPTKSVNLMRTSSSSSHSEKSMAEKDATVKKLEDQMGALTEQLRHCVRPFFPEEVGADRSRKWSYKIRSTRSRSWMRLSRSLIGNVSVISYQA
jgi:DNA repair exonuclease SbcCD ATPase subunit